MVLPEYGRNIQNMVDYCVTIQDREERKRCADTIINIMGNMFPHLRDVNDFKHILWDHLAIMSDFKLDIDYPYEIVKKEELDTRPPRLPYNNSRIRYRHYGKTLEHLIQKATAFEPGPEKDQTAERSWHVIIRPTTITTRRIRKGDEFICHRRRLSFVRRNHSAGCEE